MTMLDTTPPAPTATSAAWEARAKADATGKEFTEALVRYLPVLDREVAHYLDRLLAQVKADEYEAGWATGYAQHPANRTV